MGTLALVVRIALAAVFVVSAVAKLTDRDGTRQAVAGFGVPARLVGVATLLLAPAELVTAALLLPDATAAVGLVLTLGLLAAFTTVVVLALRAGRTVDCHCFGRLGGADISLRTVVRNGVLALLAVVGLAGLGADRDSGVPLALALGLVLASGVVAVEGLAGRAARLRRERTEEQAFEEAMVETPAGGQPAPEFRLPTLAGGEETLDGLLADGRPLLLTFMMPGCGPCKAMRPAVARWVDAYPDRVRVVAVSRLTAEANVESYADFPRLEVLIDEDGAVSEAFGVAGTPAAVLVGPDGRRRGGLANGERLVRRLLAAALSGDEPDLAAVPEETGTDADSLDLDSVVLPRQTVTAHEADGVTVLVDEETGAGATLDPVGAVVWSVLDGGRLQEIVDDLAAAFDTPAEVVGPDVLTMVRSLGRAGMLAGVAAEPTSDEVDHGEGVDHSGHDHAGHQGHAHAH